MIKTRKRLIVLISLGILLMLIAFLAINIVNKTRPRNMIEDKLNITLPHTSKILNYDVDIISQYFNVKILIDTENIDMVKNQLNNTFGKPLKISSFQFPNFRNSCEWWDIDSKSNIIAYYNGFFSGKNFLQPKSYDVWAFITKSGNEQYHLYISY